MVHVLSQIWKLKKNDLKVEEKLLGIRKGAGGGGGPCMHVWKYSSEFHFFLQLLCETNYNKNKYRTYGASKNNKINLDSGRY